MEKLIYLQSGTDFEGWKERLFSSIPDSSWLYDPATHTELENVNAKKNATKHFIYFGQSSTGVLPSSSFVIAAVSLCNDLNNTVLCFDQTGLNEEQATKLVETRMFLQKNFPEALYFNDEAEAFEWIISELRK